MQEARTEEKLESYYSVIFKMMAWVIIPMFGGLFFVILPLTFYLSQIGGVIFIPVIMIGFIGGYLIFFFKVIYPKYKPRLIRAAMRYQSNNGNMKIIQNTPEYQQMVSEQMNSPAMQQFKEQMKAELRKEMKEEQSGQTTRQNSYSTSQHSSQSNYDMQEEEMKKKIREMREGL